MDMKKDANGLLSDEALVALLSQRLVPLEQRIANRGAVRELDLTELRVLAQLLTVRAALRASTLMDDVFGMAASPPPPPDEVGLAQLHATLRAQHDELILTLGGEIGDTFGRILAIARDLRRRAEVDECGT